ncbi:MAG: NTP transferase domain-containing protein [Paraglaciecola sp.]|nr:NTP transferase domain-containing protein [Paraglaciecola sp.]
MSKTIAIVGARLNSSRLAGKHLLDLAGKPLIEQLWRRLTLCQEISSVELATTSDDFNQSLVAWALKQQISCHPFEGDVNDLMARLDNIIQRQAPDFIVYICGDCPLIDPEFIDHALNKLKNSDKDSIKLHDGVHSIHEGMAFYSRKGWEKLMSVSLCAMSREHVGYADRITPVLNYLCISDSADYSKIKHRISVDTQADYRFMVEVYRRWYENHSAESIVSLKWVQQQLVEDPQLAAFNTHVQQKAADKHYAKVSLYCHFSKDIGTGHLKRCALIADALQERLGLGTQINIKGIPCSLPWLQSTAFWFEDDTHLLTKMQQDENPLFILDFNPSFIDMNVLEKNCINAQAQGKKLLALDKLAALLDNIDKLFIPGFYSSIQSSKVSFGWQNYLFNPIVPRKKQQQVLILTGGSDALGYGQTLPHLLEQAINPNWQYIWIRGPLAAAPMIDHHSSIQVNHNPNNLPQLLAESSIILSCYGLSLFESIAAQAATILLPVKHLCEPAELQALSAYEYCIVTTRLSEAVLHLERLQVNDELRCQLIDKVSTVFIDVNGMSELLKIVSELLAKN